MNNVFDYSNKITCMQSLQKCIKIEQSNMNL